MNFLKLKQYIKALTYNERTFSETPFGSSPRAEREAYIRLYDEAIKAIYPVIDEYEKAKGFSLDRQWLDKLALHTQVVIKKSRLNWQHGRLLYATLRAYLRDRVCDGQEPVTIFETGTARGFSAVCMAKAMLDAQDIGTIVTLDILPHNTPIYWNCVDDHDGKKTRQGLLSPWPNELAQCVFIQGWTRQQLQRTGLSRVHFAFLDASHTKEDVLAEYAYVRERQKLGDMIVFDDVTPGLFDGVVTAVKEIDNEGYYQVEYLTASSERGYAICKRR